MRYTVLGFNQELLIKYDLNMNEVLLLDYIYNAVASPTMIHKIENNISYVWLNHKKILEDLPILNIGEDRLKRLLQHLIEVHLIQSVRDVVGRGSKSYYCITEECEELRFSTHEVLKTTLHNDDRSVKNNTSDNKLIIDNKLNTNNSKELLQEQKRLIEKPKKKNLYQKCSDMIMDYTEDEKLRTVLGLYLKMRLEIRDKPIYANMWKGLLSKLSSLSDTVEGKLEIVQQSLDRGYLSFFPISQYSKKSFSDSSNDFKHENYYNDERYMEKEQKLREERERNGQKTKF